MRTNIPFALIAFTLFSGTLFFTSCKKDQTSTTTVTLDSTEALVSYDSTVVFSNFKTVAIADSVVVVNALTPSKELSSADSFYMKTFAASLATRGFSVVSKTSNPDLVLNITRVASTADGYLDSAAYWSNYSIFYNPALYGESGVPYAENLPNPPSIEDGVLSFELLDIKDESAKNHISIIWNGVVRGYTLLSDVNSVTTETNILFGKSPYLKTQ